MIQEYQLENGLTILGEPRVSAQSMAAGFFVRTGARDETSEISGVSHFLEHMMFKGTSRRSAEDVNREFDEMGAHSNAFTSEENTVYFGAVLPEFQSRLLDLLSDMMRPALREEDFEVEKKVILEEIALYQDQPEFTVMDLVRRVFYAEHRLGNNILGSIQSIGALQADQMRSYFQQRYAPENMILVLVGRYDWEAALEAARRTCGAWTNTAAPRDYAPAAPQAHTHVATDTRLNRAHLAFASPGFSAQDPRRRAADVLTEILGGGRGSRLYWALVEPGLVNVAQMFHDEGGGSGWFGSYLSCDPAQAEEVRTRYLEILKDASRRNIRPEEVARVTRRDAAGHVVRSETPMGRLMPVGFDWLYRQKVDSVDAEADAILAVTAEDCNALLEERPFDLISTVALGPLQAVLHPAAA